MERLYHREEVARASDDGMCRLYSRKGGPIRFQRKWGEGERDGTFDREEGLADTSGSHCGVSGKHGFLSYSN